MNEHIGVKRVLHIDAIKGIAIICVVLGHVIDGYISANMWEQHEVVLKAIFNIIYSFHMPLCFMVSGYLYKLSYFDNKGNVKKEKLKNHVFDFIIVYIIFCIMFWGSKIIIPGAVNNKSNLTDVLFIWGKPMPSFWYLYVLIGLYAVFALHKQLNYDWKVVLPILILINLISNFIGGLGNWFEVKRLLYNGLFFYIGILKCDGYKTFFKNKLNNFIVVTCGVIIAIYFIFIGKAINTIPFINAFVSIIISLSLWKLTEKISDNIFISNSGLFKGVCILGKHMIEIYTIHLFVATIVRILFVKLGFNNIIGCIILNTLITIAIPVVCGYILRKINIYKWIYRPFNSLISIRYNDK